MARLTAGFCERGRDDFLHSVSRTRNGKRTECCRQRECFDWHFHSAEIRGRLLDRPYPAENLRGTPPCSALSYLYSFS
jgi:hypothetical protein